MVALRKAIVATEPACTVGSIRLLSLAEPDSRDAFGPAGPGTRRLDSGDRPPCSDGPLASAGRTCYVRLAWLWACAVRFTLVGKVRLGREVH